MWRLWVLGALVGCGQEQTISNLVGGDGLLRFNLQFDNEQAVDLDLHVLTPSGVEVYWGALTDASGGELDVDCLCGTCPNGGNENTFWSLQSTPEVGTYTYGVFYYGACDDSVPPPVSNFTLRVLENGVEVFVQSGTLGEDDSLVGEHSYVP